MAKVRTLAFPLANYNGVRLIGARTIPDDTTVIRFELQRCTTIDPTIWPNASTEVEMGMEASFDDGGTWSPAGGFTAVGGIHILRSGAELATTSIDVGVLPGIGRQLRATFTITGGPCRTSGTIETR